jgi:putative DNA primase/helicase
MKFLKQVLVDDELIAFVQRFLGYSLTGSTEERTLAVLHGVGKNGKSTLVELFQDLLGDYSAVANPNTIMEQKHGDATVQYQLAELTGKRFVGMAETKRDVKLEESVVKQITGNDTISARSPYGKPFGYRPQFKIWFSTNHKPEIPEGSEAIWDRIKLIPFKKRFEGAGADTDLPDKLREELPGVLAWAVMGCVEWYQHGLGTAEAVEKATAAYRTETDVIERFMSERCEFGPEKVVTKADLYEAYEQWCSEEDEEPKTIKTFGSTMKEKGVVLNFTESKNNKSRIWKGIGLRGSVPSPPHGTQSVPSQKSCKQGGRPDSTGQILSDSAKVSTDGPREEGFSENGHNLSRVSRSVPQVVTPPLSWEFEDGVINYRPEAE